MSLKYVEAKCPTIVSESFVLGSTVRSGLEFADDSVRLVRSCTKPNAREFKKTALACAIGFAIMGFIGYGVKLIFIPVNNILIA